MEAEKTKKKVRMPETGKRAMKQKVLPKKLPELKELTPEIMYITFYSLSNKAKSGFAL